MNDTTGRSVVPESASQPLLTAVMVMPRSFSLLTTSLSHLSRQSIKDKIELVLVHTPSFRSTIDLSTYGGFHSVKLIEINRVPTVAAGFVAGVAAASAPVVSLVEDHAFLDTQWAESVSDAHRQVCAAVVPKMMNGNPATVWSWANFLHCFCEPFAMRAAGPVESGPGHNTSYKRDVLHAYGEELESLFQSERTFHYRLQREGYRMLSEPRARLRHVNISIPSKVLSHAFIGGALFGKYRSVGMSFGERLARTILAPVVPPLRFWRMIRTLGVSQFTSSETPSAALLLAPVLFVVHATGEVAGYWGLVPHVEARYQFFELHRVDCVRQDERSLLVDRNF